MKDTLDISQLDRSELRRKLDAVSAHLAACDQGIAAGIGRPPGPAGGQRDITADVKPPEAAGALVRLSGMCRRAASRLSDATAGAGGESAGLATIAALVRNKLRSPRRSATPSLSIFRDGRRERIGRWPDPKRSAATTGRQA